MRKIKCVVSRQYNDTIQTAFTRTHALSMSRLTGGDSGARSIRVHKLGKPIDFNSIKLGTNRVRRRHGKGGILRGGDRRSGKEDGNSGLEVHGFDLLAMLTRFV